MAEKDNNNKRVIYDVTRSSVVSSIETRGIKNTKYKKPTRLNKKTFNPVGVALRCRRDTSLRQLPDDNLNQLKKISLSCALHRLENRKPEKIMM